MRTSVISSLFDIPCRNLQLNRLPSCQLKLSTSKSFSFSTNLSHSFFTKGCLSMSTFQRSNHYDVVCMARRYAPNSSLRKKLSRKRGGDHRKKKKRRRRKRSKKRKGREGKTKKKKEFKVVRLVSTAGTGVFYAKKKSRQLKEKLKIQKYDPQLRHHILFEEAK
ncbi:hypothetical protein DITRI_Ditri14bG0111600 [Diplodiscus trichospermus]